MTTPQASDESLAVKAAGGDDLAFAELIRRHQPALVRLLGRYLYDRDQAQEAAHEAFVSAWRSLGRYDPSRSFGSWLRTIAVNKARDHGRRLRVRRLIFGEPAKRSEEFDGQFVHPSPSAEQALVARQELAVVECAIFELPAALKEPLLLVIFDGRSQAEAAEILGVTAKAVETRLRRARQQLKAKLEQSYAAGS